MRVPFAVAVAAGAALALATPGRADDTPAPPAASSPSLQFDGFLSVVYSLNDNRPASGTNQLRAFDVDDRRLEVSVAELVVQKPAASPGTWGFRVDAEGGSTVPRTEAAAGFFRNTSGVAHDFDIQQAFVSWIAPLGAGLRLDAGKFVTHMGYELIEGYDGYNDNVTRSILFGYAIPFTHTGLRLSYAFGPKFSAQLHLVQGWDTVRDNNTGKSVGLQLAYVPVKNVSLILNTMSGPERADDNSHVRHMADVVATWQINPVFSVGANVDYGHEAAAAADGTAAHWSGVALYAKATVHPRVSIAVRAESFDDAEGVRTGLVQRVREITLTPQWALSPHFVLRADLRADHSDADAFEAKSGAKRDQRTVALNAIALF